MANERTHFVQQCVRVRIWSNWILPCYGELTLCGKCTLTSSSRWRHTTFLRMFLMFLFEKRHVAMRNTRRTNRTSATLQRNTLTFSCVGSSLPLMGCIQAQGMNCFFHLGDTEVYVGPFLGTRYTPFRYCHICAEKLHRKAFEKQVRQKHSEHLHA